MLQAPLVDRTKRKVVLTPLGDDIAERARQMLQQAEDLVRTARAESEPLAGALRMGVVQTVGPFLLPRVLPRLRRAYPKLRLYLVEDLTARLVEDLHTGRLDVVLLALPYDCGNVETRILFQDPFKIALPKAHRLAGSEEVELDGLASEEWLLLKEGHCLRDQALAACRLANRPEVETVGATSLYTLVQMTDNGLGITLLPQLAISSGILRGTSLVVLPFKDDQASRDIGLVWRRGTGRRAEFDLLASMLAQIIEEDHPIIDSIT